jgi:hypothetical protein
MLSLSVLRSYSDRYFIQRLSLSYSAVGLSIAGRRTVIACTIRNDNISVVSYQCLNFNFSSLPISKRFTFSIKEAGNSSKLNAKDESSETACSAKVWLDNSYPPTKNQAEDSTSKNSSSDDSSSTVSTGKNMSRSWLDQLYQRNKRIRRVVSGVVAVNGFMNSCIRSIVSKKNQQKHYDEWKKNLRLIKEYLNSTQIDQELVSTLYNRRLYGNVQLLSLSENAIIQQDYGITTTDRRDLAVLLSNDNIENSKTEKSIPTMDDALRLVILY